MTDQIIDLSVEETNKLRLSLGLAPLRSSSSPRRPSGPSHSPPSNDAPAMAQTRSDDASVLELSVDDTNALRARLGLPPLRTGRAAPTVRPPIDPGAAEREEQARLEEEVRQGMAEFQKQAVEEHKEGQDDVLSWAMAMRTTKAPVTARTVASDGSHPTAAYSDQDLQGLHVAHASTELQEGATTVLTLADASILETDESSKKVLGLNEAGEKLENVDLVDQRKVSEGLKAKRKMELGMGRAGGYAGFDDDEFEELGGALAPSRFARGFGGDEEATKSVKGFQIGSQTVEENDDGQLDLFAQHHKATTLESRADVTASDFMTVAEEMMEKEARKANKAPKFKKKKDKSSKKKEKQKKRNRVESDDEDEVPQEPTSNSLIAELEETAVAHDLVTRKRRRNDEDDKTAPEKVMSAPEPTVSSRARYEAIMSKANERTRKAFGAHTKPTRAPEIDEEPDDEFLNAALAKARRLNKLKELAAEQGARSRGAEAVVASLQASKSSAGIIPVDAPSSNAVTFSVDETREFSLALQTRAEQKRRKLAKASNDGSIIEAPEAKTLKSAEVLEEAEGDVDMADLVNDMKEEELESNGLGNGEVPLGRGLGGVLGLLKQTGDLSRPIAQREEMRGRAKDKKTYDDYEALDLSKVVRIGDNATERDREMASREVKLEYRDKNGRLLTRKEAFRELCYQFHGHGSGKRKEEKKRSQISREQSEARVASRQASEGIFGALKAAQKATGKAFIVHKT